MSAPTKWPRKKKPPANSFPCEFCSKVLSSHQALKIHRNIHTGKKPFKCNVCDFAATERKTLTCHLRRHTGETPYKCSFSGCGYSAKTSSSIGIHFSRMHSDLKPFECSLCPFKAKLNTELNQHVKNWHGEKSSGSPTTAPSDFKPFSCGDCDRKYTTNRNLRRHQQEKHSTDETSKKELKIFPCNLCESQFKTSSGLLNHTSTKHTMEKPFVCEFPSCDYSAIAQHKLKTHQRNIHKVGVEGAEIYKCGQCPYETLRKEVLKVHLGIHTTERNFSCPFENCPRTFKMKETLKQHVKTVHEMGETEKPFKCAICPFSTKTNTQLNLHNGALHSTVKEKSSLLLSCPFSDCAYKTLQSSNLKTHIKGHTNEKLYECDICRKTFLHKSSLTKHKMIHDDIKNFACTICPYRGRDSGALKDHIRGHTKEKPFLCHFSSCGASFRKPLYLKDHLATNHGKIAKEYKCSAESCTAPPFAASFQLNYHMKLEHGPLNMYKCSQADCDYESKWEVNLMRHERSTHGQEEICCSDCGIFKTKSKGSLKRHQDQYCAMRTKFKCVQRKCKFISDSLEKLSQHKMTEHGIRRQASINMNILKQKEKQKGQRK